MQRQLKRTRMILARIKRSIKIADAEWGHRCRDVFLPCLYPSLGVRKQTFKVLFENLQAMDRKPVFIVETGTARSGLSNPEGDGCSTYQFDAFARYSGEIG